MARKIIQSGYHQWRFKILRVVTKTPAMLVGIWRLTQFEVPAPNSLFLNDQSYGYYAVEGIFGNGHKGTKCGKGDIIEMAVDFDKIKPYMSFTMIKNGKQINFVPRVIERAQYRAAVYLYNGEQIQFLEYKDYSTVSTETIRKQRRRKRKPQMRLRSNVQL